MSSFQNLKSKKFHHDDSFVFESLDKTTDEDGTRFYCTPTGEKYVSMTTALKWMSEKGIRDWKKKVGEEEAKKVSEHATYKGNGLHMMCENYLNNESIRNHTERFIPHKFAFTQIKPLLNRIDNVIAIEKPLYSHKYKLAGQVDCIAEFDGVLSVIDFKSTGKPKKKEWITSYFIQETGYAKMFEEMFSIEIPQIVTIMANINDHKPQLFIEPRAEWDEAFDVAIDHYYTKVHK